MRDGEKFFQSMTTTFIYTEDLWLVQGSAYGPAQLSIELGTFLLFHNELRTIHSVSCQLWQGHHINPEDPWKTASVIELNIWS